MSDVLTIAPVDFHVHTGMSHDGSGTVMEYCELAVDNGMKAVGFCEHVDLDPQDFVSGQHDYEEYRRSVEEARARLGHSIQIMMGAEVGFVPRISEDILQYLKEHQYDYVVGAVHTVFDGESGISDEYDALEAFARHDLWALYENYFDTVAEMVTSGLFDVVGHLDLVQRFGCQKLEEDVQWGRFYGVLRRIFEGAVKRQMPVEINTSGLRQHPQSTYPCKEILKIYKELSGEAVMLGSDAHKPTDLGAGIPAAVRLARELGLDPSFSLKDRLPVRIEW